MDLDFRVGKWNVNSKLGEIDCDEGKVVLKPRIMELLLYLAKHQGEVLSKEHLLDTIWKDTFVTENTLMNAVSELRKALGDETRDPDFITTHSKRGYRLIANVAGTPMPLKAKSKAEKPLLRVAVLPFRSHWQRPADDRLAESLTHMVVTALAASVSFQVVSQISATLCLREAVTLPELVGRLKVQRVLEGEVLRSEDRLWVTARLYNEEDESLWGELLEQQVGEQQPSLDELARLIVHRIEAT
jgi:DNA-binding winged helix-turn-helix (wHTH) protein